MIYRRGRCQSRNEINGSSQQSVINVPRAGWVSKSDAVGVFSITLCNSLCLEASRKSVLSGSGDLWVLEGDGKETASWQRLCKKTGVETASVMPTRLSCPESLEHIFMADGEILALRAEKWLLVKSTYFSC